MKTMIISDIKGKSASIIPYGLNLARFLQSETEVIHVIDPRVCQGVATPYADSQTVAPGEKLSHNEIIGKEKGEVSAFLNQMVGREVSRLNYPLQVKVTVDETSIINKLALSADPSDTILLVNKEPDGEIFISQKEMTDTCKNFSGLVPFIPAGAEFRAFRDILLPTDLSPGDTNASEKMSQFTGHFRPFINAVTGTGHDEPEAAQWKSKAEKIFAHSEINCHAIRGDLRDNTLIGYIRKIHPDLVLIGERRHSFMKNLLKKEFITRLLKETNVPVLYFSQPAKAGLAATGS